MQLIRTLCVVAVLGALTYGAYVTLTGSPPVEPPLDAVNWDSPPHIELPASATPAAPAPAALPPAAKSTPAPKFPSLESAGAAKLDTPTDPVAGTPLKSTIIGVRADTNTSREPPLSYPSTGAAPGPFDTAGSAPLATATPAPPVASSISAGPILPGVSLPPAPESSPPPPVTPAGGVPLTSPAVPTTSSSDVSLTSSAPLAVAPSSHVPFDEIQALATTKPTEALEKLSRFFDDPALSPEESRRVAEMLDYLAGAVVYSREHCLEPPHTVRPGERLDQIAAQYGVSPELLAKINGLPGGADLTPGIQLKVVRGPFGALVDKSRRQLSVFLGPLYAGSFNIGFGQDRPPVDGQFSIIEKTAFQPPPGAMPPSGAVSHQLNLGSGMSLHTDGGEAPLDNDRARGCIRLQSAQSSDVYDILSVGSQVIVRP